MKFKSRWNENPFYEKVGCRYFCVFCLMKALLGFNSREEILQHLKDEHPKEIKKATK